MSIERKVVDFIAAASILVGLGACSSARGSAQSTRSLEKGATIGISMPTKSAERWNKDGRNLKNKLEKAGYKVILSYADDKPAQQNADIENMVNNNAKIIVVGAKDGTSVGSAVEKAHEAGAKVIAYDRLIMNTQAVDYYATFQLEKVGELQAKYIIDKLGLDKGAKGPFNMEVFTGSPDDNNAKYFFKGAWDLLQPYFKSGVLRSLSKHGGGVDGNFTVDKWQSISVMSWKTEQTQIDMESILDSSYAHDEKLDAVLCPNDDLAQGVINALQVKRPDMKPGSDNWPIITGQDANEISVSNIAKDLQSMTVFKDVAELADSVYAMIVQIAEGKKPSSINGAMNNGAKNVESSLLDPITLTKSNLDVVAKTGFISKERYDQLVN
ncbi:sugar ABC transporter substrate-binding protein [Alloscardovia omnicolens]|uniref:substrate-binding domain-containing protein n=1 Tax=Alloscardovia omnicolens TaxID=419015 RepID=UPI00254F10E1|nr:sugar-binding protein [Alloscardovia omnicolens]MDK6664195.1 sugar ABC transporter substrate-binding protein [Alloscardovia omnicolens]MDK7748567.1 sugar ABC transporter substrate-binding protein [Alloscardovia omnicolens]